MQAPFGVGIQLAFVLLQVGDQGQAMRLALGQLPQAVDFQSNIDQSQRLPQMMGQQNDLGIHFGACKTQGLGPNLVKLAVTTTLRPFMAKHWAHVIQPFATLVQHGMLNAGANHTGGVFWPQGQLFTIQSVGKGIHLLLNDVGDFTQAAHKQTRGLHDGGA